MPTGGKPSSLHIMLPRQCSLPSPTGTLNKLMNACWYVALHRVTQSMAYTRSTELPAAIIIARCISMALSSHHASRIRNNLRLHANPLISIHFRSAIGFNLVFISQFFCIIIWEWNTRALGLLVLLAIILPRAGPVYRHVTICGPRFWFPIHSRQMRCFLYRK